MFELAQPQVSEDLDALDGVDLRMQVAHPQPLFEQVVGEVLGHALRERGDQHPVALVDALARLLHQIVDLPLGRLHDHLGVDETRRAQDLFDDL